VSPGWREVPEFDKAGALCFFIFKFLILKAFTSVDCNSDNNINRAVIVLIMTTKLLRIIKSYQYDIRNDEPTYIGGVVSCAVVV